MFPVSENLFWREKNTGFSINSYHKTAAAIDKSDEPNDGLFLLLLFSIINCGVCWLSGGYSPFALATHLLGGYVVLNDIYFDVSERNICRDCIDELQGRGKSETVKKMWDINLYGVD